MKKVKVAVIDMYTGEAKNIIAYMDTLGGLTLDGAYDVITVTEIED